ncbi:diguanylate cyclase domain-containing protein, partial [Methylopila musalis]
APLKALSRAVLRPSAGAPGLARVAERADEIGALARAHLHVSRRLARSEAAVRRLTHEDALTGLPNLEALRHRLALRLQLGESAVLLRIEITGLGRVAIALGEAASEQALVAAAERLNDVVARWTAEATDADGRELMLARTGEAEFSLLLTEQASEEAGDALARRALGAFDAPVVVEAQSVALSLSIGLAAAPLHGDEAGALTRSAS